jgi:hypothetical protein
MTVEYTICRLSRNGRVVGLGFAVDPMHVVTCAHVINKAHEGDEALPPRTLTQADFPDTGVTLTVEFLIGRHSGADPDQGAVREPLTGVFGAGWLAALGSGLVRR